MAKRHRVFLGMGQTLPGTLELFLGVFLLLGKTHRFPGTRPVFLGTIAPFLGIAKGFPGAFWFLGTNWPFLGIWPFMKSGEGDG